MFSRRQTLILLINPGRRFTLPWAELSKAFSLKNHKIKSTFLCNH